MTEKRNYHPGIYVYLKQFLKLSTFDINRKYSNFYNNLRLESLAGGVGDSEDRKRG